MLKQASPSVINLGTLITATRIGVLMRGAGSVKCFRRTINDELLTMGAIDRLSRVRPDGWLSCLLNIQLAHA